MKLKMKIGAIFVIWSFLGTFTSTMGTETDIYCLKSIKSSFGDPKGRLRSWNFTHQTAGFICSFVGVTCWHEFENKVFGIQLRDMGLKGQFPDGIENCTSLTTLDLSGNHLQGPIPSDIGKKLPYVTTLDLSHNNFSGEIPAGIANCSHLNVLKLDHNRLTGTIPQQIGWLSRMKRFDVSNNLLSGPVPDFVFDNSTVQNYTNNPDLCLKSSGCEKFNWKFDYSFKGGFQIGYIVSAISAIVVYASYCVPWMYMGKKDGTVTIPSMVMLMIRKNHKGSELEEQWNSLSTTEFLLEREVSTSENFVTRMSLKDLRNATDNFSQNNIIGFGEMGTMYKATLPNGWSLAVKKYSNTQQSEEQFITELKILGKLRHDNLLPLLGFCKESKKRFLVYKYITNGNLFDLLHSTEDEKKILKWPLRMKVAAGLARGLSWLHHCCEFRVAHLNISSKCVLLDQNFEPKLSNFGMATLINPKEISGSRGFCIDIEFWEECFIKEDVYNFGLVLLELITGKNATSLNASDGMLDKLIGTDFSSLKVSDLNDVIDEFLIRDGHDDEIFMCLKIACNCVHSLPEKRPTMLDVYTTLSIIRDKYCE